MKKNFFFRLKKFLKHNAIISFYILLLPLNLLLFSAYAENNNSISIAEVTQKTLSAFQNCVQYKIIGACYWLNCKGSICRTTTTLKVKHYLPDAVVSVYQDKNSNPWDYANHIIDPHAYQLGKTQMKTLTGQNIGFGNESASLPQEQDTHFKEVDVIGNPAVSIIKKMGHDGLIPSSAVSMMPYYISLADAYVWRSPLIEMAHYPQYLLPGVHIVGSLSNNWGAVYPRTGFLLQPQDVKAAAVIAQRGVDIATKVNQLHISHFLPTGDKACGTACKVDETEENNVNILFQMIYPIADTQCDFFGKQDFDEAQKKSDGNYVWILWRHYQGCIPGEGKFLGSTNIPSSE